MELDASVYVHPTALCETSEIGNGTRIWAFVHLMEGAKIGSDCNICDNVFVESGAIVGNGVTVKNSVLIWDKVTIEDEVFLGPNVVFTNDKVPRSGQFKNAPDKFFLTTVKHGASIGANATIICDVIIGEYALVGAGSLINKNVPAYALMVGNPGRQIGWVCACGKNLNKEYVCECSRRYGLRDKDLGLEPI